MILSSPRKSYDELYNYIKGSSSRPAPRGRETVEVMGLQLNFDDPTDCMTFGGQEMITYVLSEIRTVKANESPDRKAPQRLIDKLDLERDGTFFEEGIREAVGGNWDTWVRRFENDSDTRKCAATFTRPSDGDPPCTMTMQFLYRDGKMNLITFNRSQDMTFAYKMDCALFGNLLTDMAHEVGADVGRWIHNIGSAHIYESDI